MARITFTLTEIMNILDSNEQIHRDISDMRVEGADVHFNINTNLPLIHKVPASAHFVSFDDGIMKLRMTIHGLPPALVSKGIKLLSHKFDENVPEFITMEYPYMYIDVPEAISANIKGVRVDEIYHQDGHFTVITSNL